MLADFSGLHVQGFRIFGAELALNQARSPSFRVGIEHLIYSLISSACCKPNLALAVVRCNANQMDLGDAVFQVISIARMTYDSGP
ncbi:hypothetical protein AS156_28850 [Bradyrhizobium macuxiense]|uniref:Uncharacterized protein n=1 Tax=Bradyrhizobium macuxiense TaxID=1755647 RepID=A0A109K4A5_9BRAD|nr:hypothetical protein AS156_28850 [Bradyrhizobium macuxiense]